MRRSAPPRLILGSTSVYRAELLRRLGVDFEQRAPGVTETASPGEAPADLALRLAIAKADAAAAGQADVLSIGSDQVAELEGEALGKPGTVERAVAQLVACAGRQVQFHTALCLFETCNGRRHTHVDSTRVYFRPLQPDEIARYIQHDQPLDCAGSFKCEGLGISLFERVESDDPTALVGLPLIALARLLRDVGLSVP